MKWIGVWILISLFIGCSLESSEYSPRNLENSFTGVWLEPKYGAIPFGANLNILPNGSFTYSGGACMVNFKGSGYWIRSNESITLYSDTIRHCEDELAFGADCILIDNSKIPPKPSSLPPCNHGDVEQIIIFEDVQLSLNHDTLWHVNSEIVTCPEMKGRFVR
ncbi:MAG: hypothetical protein EP346_10460 [Bacteroidetes bacterium]|nr:MAG: hypothetical protein EP346_10460 [Bacteroidota bacterium]